jgi:mannose-1-phosphate guanylyltransferase
MILAAGKGTRLRPLTDAVPKPLLDVAGRPMIGFALELLRAAGIRDIVINLHHLGDQIRATLGDGRAYGVHLHYSEENPILDTGGGIAKARDFLAGEPFVVLNSDIFVDIALSDVITFHHDHGALATMVLRRDQEPERYPTIEIDADQRIRRFLGRAPAQGLAVPEADLSAFMYAGILVFEPRIFTYLPPGTYSITRDVFPRLLDVAEPLFGYVHAGFWQVLDTPEDLQAGRRQIAARLATAAATALRPRPGSGKDGISS